MEANHQVFMLVLVSGSSMDSSHQFVLAIYGGVLSVKISAYKCHTVRCIQRNYAVVWNMCLCCGLPHMPKEPRISGMTELHGACGIGHSDI
jgi:hypothetical protein